jgi:hypothetical protein
MEPGLTDDSGEEGDELSGFASDYEAGSTVSGMQENGRNGSVTNTDEDDYKAAFDAFEEAMREDDFK